MNNVLTYEQLKQRLDAVVAENVALREAADDYANECASWQESSYNGEITTHRQERVDAIKTPATAAALA